MSNENQIGHSCSAVPTSAPTARAVELTFEEFCERPMQYRIGLSFDTGARRLYRNDHLQIQKEVYTPRNPRTLRWGTGQVSYFLDDDPREFTTVADLYVAWMERVCGVEASCV